jgi:hypothetical protein
MAQLLCEHRDKLAALEHLVTLVQLRHDVDGYELWIKRTRARLLDHFAGLFLEKAENDEKLRFEKAGKQFSQEVFLTGHVNRKLVFHSWVAILNRMDSRTLPTDKRLATVFKKHMQTEVSKRVCQWRKEHTETADGLGAVRKILARAARAQLGARLRTYIEAVELITLVEKSRPDGQNLEWQLMFEYVMAPQDPAVVFQSFLAWNGSVFNNGASRQFIGDERQGALDQLLNGFVTMCVGSPELQKRLPTLLWSGSKGRRK